MMERLKFLEKQREEEDRRNALDETQKEELEQYEDALRKQLIRVAEQAQETERLIEKAEDKMDVLTPEQQKLYEELEEKWEEEHALRQQRIRGHEQQLKALRTSLDLLMREEREAQGSANTVQELHAEASAKAKEVSDALKRLLSQAHDAKQNLEEMRQLATTSAQQRQSLLRLQQELHTQLAQERSLQQDLRRIAQEREVCETLRNRISHAGIHGSALDCCKPSSKRLSLAVAAAMGSKANSLIVSSHAIALKCIEYLKTARLGCREFLPLDTLQRRRLQGGERTALSEFNEDDEDDGENDDEGGGVLLPPPPHDALPGGCRWAVDCVSFEESFRPVYEFLLSDCIIVPSLEIAQELKYGSSSSSSSSSGRSKRTSQSPLQKYRFVTLDGEKLQRGGVISFDVGGLTGRLAARWEAGEQHRLLERVERVKEQLQTLDNAEATNAERLRQRNEQFACLHRQCVQLQAKAKVWEAQAEAKDQRITELQKKVQALQESIVARKKEIL
ncbi:smc n terminal domain-containing protein, partial [Cystoisospora suis]